MSKARYSFLPITFVSLLVASGTEARQQGDTDGDMEDLRVANEAFYDSISGEDMARIDALWSHEPHVRAIHPVSLQVEKGWETVRSTFQDIVDRYDDIHSAMPVPQIRLGEKVAWVTGEEEFRATSVSSGQEISVTLLGTNVFEKVEDRWLMVHHHVSVAATPDK